MSIHDYDPEAQVAWDMALEGLPVDPSLQHTHLPVDVMTTNPYWTAVRDHDSFSVTGDRGTGASGTMTNDISYDGSWSISCDIEELSPRYEGLSTQCSFSCDIDDYVCGESLSITHVRGNP